jgi:ABC-type oligopeptide transport system, periplasmic component
VKRLSSRLAAFAVLAALAVFPAACRPKPEGTVKVVVIGREPQPRDPALGPLAAPDAVLLQNVAQGLVRFDASGNIVAGLAERWNVSDDGLSYIFRIASTDWPDGRKINAQQVRGC